MNTDKLQIIVHAKDGLNYACFRLPGQPEIPGLTEIFSFSWPLISGDLEETKRFLISKARREIRKRHLADAANWNI